MCPQSFVIATTLKFPDDTTSLMFYSEHKEWDFKSVLFCVDETQYKINENGLFTCICSFDPCCKRTSVRQQVGETYCTRPD